MDTDLAEMMHNQSKRYTETVKKRLINHDSFKVLRSYLVQKMMIDDLVYDTNTHKWNTLFGGNFRSLRQAKVWIKKNSGTIFIDVGYTPPKPVEYIDLNC